MDAATHEALSGIRSAISDLKSEAAGFRNDFNLHVAEDQAMRSQVDRWTGALMIIRWMVGLGVPAILAFLVAIAKHLGMIS